MSEAMTSKDEAEGLIKRLRDVVPYQGKSSVAFLCHEAADAIAALALPATVSGRDETMSFGETLSLLYLETEFFTAQVMAAKHGISFDDKEFVVDQLKAALTALGAACCVVRNSGLSPLSTPAATASTGRPPSEGWRPIEEAPKDGTWVLAFCPHSTVPVVVHYALLTGGHAWTDEVGDGCGSWETYDPTHFMPLPAPPALTTEGVSR